MEKEQRDLNWKCLPKGTRDFIKCQLKAKSDCPDFDEGYDQALIDLFGKQNLESGTEPSELLFVERKKVQEYKADIEYTLAGSFSSEYSKGYWRGQQTALDRLFGDKCLPDKPINGAIGTTPPSYKLDVKPEQPSVQVEPKFKYNINDKVILKGSDKPMLIRQRVGFKDYDNGYQITTLDTRYPQWVKESDLEPYTEPETKPFRVGDKVKVKGEDKVREIFRILPDGRIMFGDKGNTYSAENLELVEPEYRNLSQEIANCDKSEDNQLKDNAQQNSWDEDFKKMNECFEKIQKTLSSLCDTFGKLEANVNKLNRL